MKDKYSVIGVENNFQRVIQEGLSFESALEIASDANEFFDKVSISLDHELKNPSKNILVFSDCQMMLGEVKSLLKDRPKDVNEQKVFLGNFITGDSKFSQFMDYLIKLKSSGEDIVLVRGRNEHNLLQAIDGTHSYVGTGEEVDNLLSGVEKQLKFPLKDMKSKKPEYYELIKNTHEYYENDKHIFVSGGLDLRGSWRKTPVEQLYNTTQEFIRSENNTGKIIVFGSEPVVVLNRVSLIKPWFNPEADKIGINGDVRHDGRLIGLVISGEQRNFIGIRTLNKRKKTYAYDIFS